MAYSSLLSLGSTIDQILDHHQFSVSPHQEKQIISLGRCVILLQAFLEDSPEKAVILETLMRDVAAEAEHILEWFLLEPIPHGNMYTKWIANLSGIMFKYQLHRVINEIDSIAAEVVEIKNNIIIKQVQLGNSFRATSSSQVADTRKINLVGFNEDLIEIKEKLCGWAAQLQVLAIFGMGGIGKTTLARNVYHDQLIVEHFHIRVWVTISQDYSERRILVDLLGSMREFDPDLRKGSMKETTEKCNESLGKIELRNSEMALKVHKILMGRRFLIVMDDIWRTEVLDDVKKLFPNDNNGSRIMLTTRLTEVATYASSSTLPHEMRLMDDDQSWDLLRQKLSAHKDFVPTELDIIGREIVKSCKGLPLAIVVIAGLLSCKSPTLWGEVARNIRSYLSTADGQIEKILSLSYNHLPHHLRPCFLYMGGFPEDHEIKVKDLIRLWIAESFVKPVESKRLEDIAEAYLDNLVNRSLIIVTKRKSDGKIKCCSLHDVVREMVIKLCREEKFLVHVKGSQQLRRKKDLRRISVSHCDLNSFSNIHSSTIRAIRSLKLVRVLDLLNAGCMLPDQLFELFHLRYLAFGFCYSIPRSIHNLQSLQTLIIARIRDKCLPYEIWNMRQLRHLIISKSRLPDTNADTSGLENQQTLGKVENLTCSLELKLGYGWNNHSKPNLVVPSSLKKLTLISWGHFGSYLDIVGPFPNLELLKLKTIDFKPREWRTTDENFPQLKFLLIEESDLRQWDTESSHFPRLKALLIHYCSYPDEVPECIGEIPTLKLIELKRCEESLANSAKRIQEEAQSYDDDAFQDTHHLEGAVLKTEHHFSGCLK